MATIYYAANLAERAPKYLDKVLFADTAAELAERIYKTGFKYSEIGECCSVKKPIEIWAEKEGLDIRSFDTCKKWINRNK